MKLDQSNYQLSLARAKASLELAKQQAALAQEKIPEIAIEIPSPQPVTENKKAQIQQQAFRKKRTLQLQVLNQQKKINEQQYKVANTNLILSCIE
ncbi:hypothetical protein [Nostoc flagelliforme]|uniref:hypothetical protein n=1 Tax=Nostoc flagelliforme TaxID=1306274 RepID=UPI0016892298|nr:hypothetical protein [Nostoc flagelliforme]